MTLLLSLSLSLSLSAQASPLNPWLAEPTSTGAVGLTQYVYVYPSDGIVEPITYLATGLGDHADIILGGGLDLGGSPFGVAPISMELMPRFFVAEGFAVAAHTFWVPGASDLLVGPELQWSKAFGSASVAVNAGWKPSLGASGFDANVVAALVAPEYALSDRVGAFVEVNPVVALSANAATSVTVVPGASLIFGEDSAHSAAIGVQIPVYPAVGVPSAGLWYSYTFGS